AECPSVVESARWVEEGKTASWRWRRKVNDHIEVVVELLRDAGDEAPGRPIVVV
ncbi:hypothetical protein Pgy4_36645, partial [Pseudomonas savastanoi pv. glycinea str. race 4]